MSDYLAGCAELGPPGSSSGRQSRTYPRCDSPRPLLRVAERVMRLATFTGGPVRVEALLWPNGQFLWIVFACI